MVPIVVLRAVLIGDRLVVVLRVMIQVFCRMDSMAPFSLVLRRRRLGRRRHLCSDLVRQLLVFQIWPVVALVATHVAWTAGRPVVVSRLMMQASCRMGSMVRLSLVPRQRPLRRRCLCSDLVQQLRELGLSFDLVRRLPG